MRLSGSAAGFGLVSHGWLARVDVSLARRVPLCGRSACSTCYVRLKVVVFKVFDLGSGLRVPPFPIFLSLIETPNN